MAQPSHGEPLVIKRGVWGARSKCSHALTLAAPHQFGCQNICMLQMTPMPCCPGAPQHPSYLREDSCTPSNPRGRHGSAKRPGRHQGAAWQTKLLDYTQVRIPCLDVHLEGCDGVLTASNLEVHVPEGIFRTWAHMSCKEVCVVWRVHA